MTEAQDKVSKKISARISKWQSMLLPFMLLMLGGLTVTFFGASLWQFTKIQNQIEKIPDEIKLDNVFSDLKNKPLSESNHLVYVQWKTLALLEKNVIERRYHQANILLMARTWTRYLGFLTGMILALVGAAFILGKLREESSEATATSAEAGFSFKSNSPGLILAFLGTLLMLATIFIHNQIEVNDAPIYTNIYLEPSKNDNNKPRPKSLNFESQSDTIPFPERTTNK